MKEPIKRVSQSLLYMNHFRITASLAPSKTGLIIHIMFDNEPLPGNQQTPNIEVWFPINGHLEYIYRTTEDQIRVLVGQIYDISTLETGVYDYLITPGKNAEALFYVRIPIDHVERMKEIIDREGAITLLLHLYFSILYNAGRVVGIPQKTYKLHSIFEFNVPKVVIENWMTQWMESYAQYVDLPPTIPKEVLSDYIEAVKSFNVGAYKAAVAMARRALQQALEDKGASRGKRLLDQINELRNKGILDKAIASLAHGIRQFGNYGAHPQTDLLTQVTRDDAKLVIDVTKKLLKELYRT